MSKDTAADTLDDLKRVAGLAGLPVPDLAWR